MLLDEALHAAPLPGTVTAATEEIEVAVRQEHKSAPNERWYSLGYYEPADGMLHTLEIGTIDYAVLVGSLGEYGIPATYDGWCIGGAT